MQFHRNEHLSPFELSSPRIKIVVMETIRPAKILANSESTQIKSKIPEYARDYRNEYLFIRGIDNLTLAGNLKIYIEEVIMRLKMQSNSHEENWSKNIIYEMILNLVN